MFNKGYGAAFVLAIRSSSLWSAVNKINMILKLNWFDEKSISTRCTICNEVIRTYGSDESYGTFNLSLLCDKCNTDRSSVNIFKHVENFEETLKFSNDTMNILKAFNEMGKKTSKFKHFHSIDSLPWQDKETSLFSHLKNL